MAKARAIPDLMATDPYAAAAAKILAVRSQELADHSRAVLELDDIEPLHDMRVATRRLRAALEVFDACFEGNAHEAVVVEVKALADALGERRDRDVAIESLEAFGSKLPAPDRRGVQSLIETLRLEQAEANEALRPHVSDERIAGLRERLRELVAEAEDAAGTKPGAAEAAALAKASGGNGAGAIGSE
jgi:CHAD domain-containing protein